jgi:hypothetical protein
MYDFIGFALIYSRTVIDRKPRQGGLMLCNSDYNYPFLLGSRLAELLKYEAFRHNPQYIQWRYRCFVTMTVTGLSCRD